MRDIKVLHIEPTDVCQAACPLCARETDTAFDKQQHHHLDMQKIMHVITTDQISRLDKMFMCGNYGDPAAGKHTLDIYRQFRKINSNIVLGMNSNGALRNRDWWQELGELFYQSFDYVVFSIDGLSDTNNIYRVNVNWDQLICNAQAFISAGGSAHWDMLIYQHNEHQVKSCQQLAKQLGFKWFRAKVSKRPFTNNLSAPVNWVAPLKGGVISCHALKEHSMYIDAQGKSFPCCWIGSDQHHPAVDLTTIAATWNTNFPNKVCSQTCASINNSTTFEQQWKIEEQLC